MTDFSLVGLRVVREVARQGSISAAAERLGYTQSAASRQVALMERIAGRPLFTRHPRGVEVTSAGEVVVRRADEILGQLDATRAELDDIERRADLRLTVGGFSTSLAALVPRAVARMCAAHPGARIRLREGGTQSLLRAVAKRRIQTAVVTAPEEAPSGVELRDLLDDPLLVLVARAHRLAGERLVPVEALREEAWVAGSADPASTLLGTWQVPGRSRPHIAYVARDWTAKIGLVAAGLGVTVVPGLALPALPTSVAAVRVDDPLAHRRVALARALSSSDDELAAIAKLEAALHDEAAELDAYVRARLRG